MSTSKKRKLSANLSSTLLSSPHSPARKPRHSTGHAPNCEDSLCEGCDVGEIEVSFALTDGTTPPGPSDLFRMAVKESEKENPEEHGGGIVKKLYDMAIGEFDRALGEQEEIRRKIGKEEDLKGETSDKSKLVKGKEKGREEEYGSYTSLLRDYAMCCLSFGKYMPLISYIKKSIELFEKVIDENNDDGEAWIGLARARIALARMNLPSPGDEEGESDKEENFSQSQKEFLNGKEAYERGLSLFRSTDMSRYISESILAAKDYYEYGVSCQPHAYGSEVFELSLEYLESATRAQTLGNPEEQDPFIAGLKGSCLYYSAMSKSADAAEEVKSFLTESIKNLKFANDHSEDSYAELLGQVYILQSTLAGNENTTMEAFELGIEYLKKAFEKNPGNKTREVNFYPDMGLT
ncbi:5189_t:CDS:2 [Paraglomus occultum]|uniref:5189_t:CDS:1 n=1 Tax=Paraglomus occultum TaxID=144539 RepID=A0A9N8WED1_9GLOM|nr:5189_t:CDS:2 [Paraglomus occultum]